MPMSFGHILSVGNGPCDKIYVLYKEPRTCLGLSFPKGSIAKGEVTIEHLVKLLIMKLPVVVDPMLKPNELDDITNEVIASAMRGKEKYLKDPICKHGYFHNMNIDEEEQSIGPLLPIDVKHHFMEARRKQVLINRL